ncbi:replication initiation protein [Rhodospirillum sp. A1_3_36]|uniref:replication initiation protein n=1 Tax=Rhodospirillum sp. A1_3_36 TaxID=3391666 RepID=UPI0039A4AB15
MSLQNNIDAKNEIVKQIFSKNPKFQRVSEDLSSSWIELSGYSHDRKYISVNNPKIDRVDFLAFDCDHEDYNYIPGRLAKPIYSAISNLTGRHHKGYILDVSVLTGENARRKPIEYLAKVQRVLTRELDADRNYVGSLTKNPMHPEWNVFVFPDAKPVRLGDFSAYFEEEKQRNFRDKFILKESFGYSRNCDLFDNTRHWRYRYTSASLAETISYADSINSLFAIPLSASEIRATARSIDKWVNTKYQGNGPRYTKRASKDDNDLKSLENALNQIEKQKLRKTPDIIAYLAGFSRDRLYRLTKKHGISI